MDWQKSSLDPLLVLTLTGEALPLQGAICTQKCNLSKVFDMRSLTIARANNVITLCCWYCLFVLSKINLLG